MARLLDVATGAVRRCFAGHTRVRVRHRCGVVEGMTRSGKEWVTVSESLWRSVKRRCVYGKERRCRAVGKKRNLPWVQRLNCCEKRKRGKRCEKV
jgi:hypothetical protein